MKIIKNVFKGIGGFVFGLSDWRKNVEEAYYAASSDHVDLERRMRQVQRGEAPWQRGMWS